MKNQALIAQGKIISKVIQSLNLGNGSTWPGHLALKTNKNFIKDVLKNSSLKVLFVVGTNGKTTTTTLLEHIFTSDGKKIIQNTSGANLLNGIASTLLLNASLSGSINGDIALFEIDENAFPLACKEVTPDAVVMLNLFRDQLDRYGEITSIVLKWQEALSSLPKSTKLFLNADDPQVAFIGSKAHQEVHYFGIDEPNRERAVIDHASDSTYCPNCGEKLSYSKSYYSHLGVWNCPSCSFSHPKQVMNSAAFYPLSGLYNKYNIHAAKLVASSFEISEARIDQALRSFKPAFGRQEKLKVDDTLTEIILAKNPASFNQALQTALDQQAHNLMLVLNDRIADGTDVSWIWDIDIESLLNKKIHLTLSGDRVFDLALRVKYAGIPQESVTIEPDLDKAVHAALQKTEKDQTLFILPTYTAMLDVRKLLTGKKIL